MDTEPEPMLYIATNMFTGTSRTRDCRHSSYTFVSTEST